LKQRNILVAIILVLGLLIFSKGNAVLADAGDAVSINTNQSYSSTLKDYDDEDYYKVTLAEDGNIILSMNQKANVSWYASIENSSGEVLEDFNTDDSAMVSGAASRQVGLPKGTYYIKIDNYYNATGVKYTFSVQFTKSSFYEKESNNSITAANAIDTDKIYKGTITDYDDSDFYKFTISEDGNIALSIKNKAGTSWFGHIQDSKGIIYEDLNSDDSELVDGYSITEVGLPKGTYYIKLNGYSSYSHVPYEFKVGYTKSNFYEKESNNNVTSANSLSLNQTYYGRISEYDDDDFYKFTLASDGKVVLSLKNLAGSSWEAKIHNSKGEIYQTLYSDDSELVDGYASASIGLPKGTYYIKMTNYSNTVNKQYELKAAFTGSNNYEKEFNDNLATANLMNLNQLYYGNSNTSYDKDIYKFTLPADGNISVKLKQVPNMDWQATVQNSSGTSYVELETNDSELATGYATANKMMKKGTYYLVIERNYGDYFNAAYAASVTLQTSPISASKVKLENNKGKDDKISVSGLVKGDVIKVYNASSKGQVIAQNTAGSSTLTLSVKQIGLKSGKVYISVTKAGMTESSRVGISYTGEQSDPLKVSQVKVYNNKGKTDAVNISGVSKGDTIKVYNASSKGKLLATKQVTGTSGSISIKQLGTKSGKVYVTITKSGMKESGRTAVSYKGEQTTALKSSQIKVTNNKKKNDTIVVKGIAKGDTIKVYNASKNWKLLASGTSKGTSSTLTVKQLGTKSGKVYITITKSGMTESSRTSVSFKKE